MLCGLRDFFFASYNCKLPEPFKIDVEFTRNDELSNATDQIGDWSLPWIESYASNPAPTLVIANTGMHEPTMVEYQYNFDMFVNTMENLGRHDDLVVYRTSVQGHLKCKEKNTKPHADASEFQVAKMHNWHYVDSFNQYTIERMRNSTVSNGWMLLDVYPMTILRPDGHKSPRPPPGRIHGDCLHYKLPGPPDYWNHLLYSNLLDMK